MYQVLPNFRTPEIIRTNRAYFVPHPTKEAVLDMLAYGLKGEWGPNLPPPGRTAANYLGSQAARGECRLRFKSEILAGRMLGGPGWTREVVRWFLGRDFYLTPCGTVRKGDNPHGRIVHNYSHEFDGVSLNDALLDN